MVHKAAAALAPAYAELVCQAAQGEVLHNDDTTMQILELGSDTRKEAEAEEEELEGERTGVFTSGIVSISEGRRIALFMTGHKHAGENLAEVLKHRAAELNAPIQMCDALSRNTTGAFETIVASCIAHARRRYVDVAGHFPDECRHVLETLGEVYRTDAQARNAARELVAVRGELERWRRGFGGRGRRIPERLWRRATGVAVHLGTAETLGASVFSTQNLLTSPLPIRTLPRSRPPLPSFAFPVHLPRVNRTRPNRLARGGGVGSASSAALSPSMPPGSFSSVPIRGAVARHAGAAPLRRRAGHRRRIDQPVPPPALGQEPGACSRDRDLEARRTHPDSPSVEGAAGAVRVDPVAPRACQPVVASVVEHVGEGVPDLARGLEDPRVVAVAEDVAPARGDAVDRARQPRRQALDPAGERQAVLRFDEEVDVVPQDRVVDDAGAARGLCSLVGRCEAGS